MNRYFVVRGLQLGSSRKGFAPRPKGVVAVLFAILLIVLMAMLAFSIDLGYHMTVQTELDRAVDAEALAGAGTLAEGTDQAIATVRDFVARNHVACAPVSEADMDIETGHWDPATRTFIASDNLPSAIKVRAEGVDKPYFFARALGYNDFDVNAEAIAIYQPRDIMLVLDYSASMSDDSELRSIGTLGRAAIEANLLQIYQQLGSPTFGNMQWNPVYIASSTNATVKTLLGLNGVPYPYPSGSWDDYINYVRNNANINNAGYRRDYGYLTLVNYWLEMKPQHNQTPDLWKTNEQPITAVKEAVTVLLSYLQEVDTDDRLGLSVYTAADGTAKLETGLTHDYPLVETISRQRQAGHYHTYTNIGAGLQKARLELDNNARPGAFKMIVLMTDGIANLPSNTTVGCQFALDEAQQCAVHTYPVVTVSLGAAADVAIMDNIAQITGGVHFNVPGGQPVAAYEEQLKDVFRKIAKDRPLKLVK